MPNGPRGQLYNLDEDISEKMNLWLEEPGLGGEFEKQIAKQKAAGRTRPPMALFRKLLRESPLTTTQRLNPEGPSEKRFLYYDIGATGRTLKGKDAKRLRNLLLAGIDSTTHHDEKLHFAPDVLLRFPQGDHEAQVTVCFCCNKWAMYLDGETTSYTSFMQERTEVLAVVKKMFPKDNFIQSLPEKIE